MYGTAIPDNLDLTIIDTFTTTAYKNNPNSDETTFTPSNDKVKLETEKVLTKNETPNYLMYVAVGFILYIFLK